VLGIRAAIARLNVLVRGVMWARWGSNPRPIDYESTTAERCAHQRFCRSALSETPTVIRSLTNPLHTARPRPDGVFSVCRPTSRYHGVMTKQTTVRLPQDLADQAEAVARVRGCSVNALIVDSLAAEIERVRKDEDFTARARRLLTRDKELLERLAQ
jgi:hypothetical protein